MRQTDGTLHELHSNTVEESHLQRKKVNIKIYPGLHSIQFVSVQSAQLAVLDPQESQ